MTKGSLLTACKGVQEKRERILSVDSLELDAVERDHHPFQQMQRQGSWTLSRVGMRTS